MPRFEKFSRRHRRVLAADIRNARGLASTCANHLGPRPGPQAHPSFKIMSLLRDTFGIPPRLFLTNNADAWAKVEPIRDNFKTCGLSVATGSYVFASDPNKVSDKQLGAYVDTRYKDRVFITKRYFATKATRESDFELRETSPKTPSVVLTSAKRARSAILVHEQIHLIYPHAGHPGGDQISPVRTRLNIPYKLAIKNPWCYHYFLQWL